MNVEPQDFEVLQRMDDTIALVLGGGRGTRLYPLTAERAKPAVPLCGRYRLIDVPLSNCIHSGVNRLFVLTQFNSASLNRHIINSYKFDAFSRGFVEILAAEQTVESGDWFQGTADAVRKHLRHFRNTQAKHYLTLSGDQLYRMDYRSLMATHLRNRADITVSVLPVTEEAAPALGILKVSPEGRITEFVEKPTTEAQLAQLRTPRSVLVGYGVEAMDAEYLASMGVYLFQADVLQNILLEKPQWVDFGRDVIPKSLESRRVFAHVFTGFWEDIGTVRSYYEVSMQLVTATPPFRFHDEIHPIYTRPRYLPGSRIQDAYVKDSIICEGSHIIQSRIENSIIGVRTIVHPNTVVERSIIMGADFYENESPANDIPVGIGAGSHISGAIVDKNARIGKNVVIRGSRELRDRSGTGFAIRDGIVIVLKNAVIPDGTHIG